ncbi:MAG: ATPase [Alphaproteobacteria bacterium]|nr:ATPase [Alphaproteobacteria bacterium]
MTEPARRFYAEAAVAPLDGGGFTVTLDGRKLRTPGRLVFATPTRALAEACAAEWAAQTAEIRPATMPLTRLVNVAVERTPQTRDAIVANVAKYAETDLLCHRADAPVRLVARQSAAWDPLLAWAAETLDVRLYPAAGIMIDPRNEEACAIVAARAAALNDFALTGLAHAAGLAGSCVIAFALARGRLSGAKAAGAASLDEEWSLETWGEDAEARARLVARAAEFASLETLFGALANPA